MVRLNVGLTVDRLRKDKDLAPLLGPQLDTVGGYYNLTTGSVDIIA
ncbi:MAG: hypothetical protein M3256_18425 [Actinomycetota bacterium]|nr:hypothetical protein [Actinomycetota bacterium]